jgi:hypothetical protein
MTYGPLADKEHYRCLSCEQHPNNLKQGQGHPRPLTLDDIERNMR